MNEQHKISVEQKGVSKLSEGSLLINEASDKKRLNLLQIFQTIRFGSSILYLLLRSKRYLAASVVKFMNIQVSGSSKTSSSSESQ